MNIVVKRQDGGVSIMHIISGTPEGEIAKSRGLTNEWTEFKNPPEKPRDTWIFEDFKGE
jgi:hypothetical protein